MFQLDGDRSRTPGSHSHPTVLGPNVSETSKYLLFSFVKFKWKN